LLKKNDAGIKAAEPVPLCGSNDKTGKEINESYRKAKPTCTKASVGCGGD
jgi:hypothetical protein